MRKLIAAVLGTVATFVMLFGAGMTSWAIVALGAALLVLAIGLVAVTAVRTGSRAWVTGSAHVHQVSEPPAAYAFGRCELQIVIDAPGLPARSVKVIDPRVPVAKWPMVGQQLPIKVAIDDQRHVRILWDEAPTHAETAARASRPADFDEFGGLDDDLLIEQDAPPWLRRDPDDEFPPAGAGEPVTADLTDDLSGLRDDPVVMHQGPGGTIVLEGTLVEPAPAAPLPRRPRPSPGPRPERATQGAQADPASAATPSATTPSAATPSAATPSAGSASAGSASGGSASGGTPSAARTVPRPTPPPDDIDLDLPVDDPDPGHRPGGGPSGDSGPGGPRSGPEPRRSDLDPSDPDLFGPDLSHPDLSAPDRSAADRSDPDLSDLSLIHPGHEGPAGSDREPAAPEMGADPGGDPSGPPLPATGTGRSAGAPAGASPISGVGITLLVTNLERSIAFYRDMLGFLEIDGGRGNAVLASGSTRLVLRTIPEVAPINRRVVHLNLEVADVEAAYQELKARGLSFTSTPRAVNRGEKMELWAAAFRDPDGHAIAITQWRDRVAG